MYMLAVVLQLFIKWSKRQAPSWDKMYHILCVGRNLFSSEVDLLWLNICECFAGKWVWCDICVLDEDWSSRVHHMTHLSMSRCLSLSTFTHFKLLSVPFAFRLIFLVLQHCLVLTHNPLLSGSHWVKFSGNILCFSLSLLFFFFKLSIFNNSLLCNNVADYSSVCVFLYMCVIGGSRLSVCVCLIKTWICTFCLNTACHLSPQSQAGHRHAQTVCERERERDDVCMSHRSLWLCS